MVEIIQDFIPKGNKNRPGYPMKPRFITIHNTGNDSPGADALMHARFVNGDPASGVSWHFTVDDTRIVQHLPLNENGWHAGDGGNGTGNRESIGIEICEVGDFEKAVANAIWLVAKLMREHGIPIENVKPHQFWSGKYCPRKLLHRWDEIIRRIKEAYQASMVDKKAKAHTVVAGDTLGGIALMYDKTVDELLKLNPEIKNPALITVGQVIYLVPRIDPVEAAVTAANVPDWARPSVTKAMRRKLLSDASGSLDFYRMIVVLDRLGLIDKYGA